MAMQTVLMTTIGKIFESCITLSSNIKLVVQPIELYRNSRLEFLTPFLIPNKN